MHVLLIIIVKKKFLLGCLTCQIQLTYSLLLMKVGWPFDDGQRCLNDILMSLFGLLDYVKGNCICFCRNELHLHA